MVTEIFIERSQCPVSKMPPVVEGDFGLRPNKKEKDQEKQQVKTTNDQDLNPQLGHIRFSK